MIANRYLLVALLLVLAPAAAAQEAPQQALPTAAQTAAASSVFKVEDASGNVLLLVNDDGTISLPNSSATNGYVLTTDASGNASWQPVPGGGGLTLPYTGVADTPDAALTVSNTNATGEGLSVPEAGNHGLYVGETTNGSGVRIFDAGDRGVHVTRSGGDGFNIGKAGDAGYTSFSSLNSGLEVGGAEGHGLHVLGADLDGVHVAYAGDQAGYFNGDVEVTYDLEVGIDLSVGGALTCANCVDGADIEDGSLTGADVQNGSLTGADIQDNSITGADISQSLTGGDIVNGTLTRDDIANETLTGAEVQDGSLTGDDVQDGSLSAAKVWNMAGGASVSDNTEIRPSRDVDTVIETLTMNVPGDGIVLVWASVQAIDGGTNPAVGVCSLTTGQYVELGNDFYFAVDADTGLFDWQAGPTEEEDGYEIISLTRSFSVGGAGTFTVNVVCRERWEDINFQDRNITALYLPNQY